MIRLRRTMPRTLLKATEPHLHLLLLSKNQNHKILKKVLDSISSKSDENENSSPLITVENGDAPVKKLNGLVEGSSFDQILDLGTVPDSNKTQSVSPGLPPPLMAFEESIQQQNNNPTDLLS